MGAPLQIFTGALTNAFQPTSAFVIPNDNQDVILKFKSTISVAAKVEWYLEFCSEDPAGTEWARELAQEDAGSGVVHMPEVVRDIVAEGGGTLAVGVHRHSAQLRRKAPFCRLQVRASVGTVDNETITSVYGDPV